jgi:hypothetical protein
MYLCIEVYIYKQCEQLCGNTSEYTIKVVNDAYEITYRNYEYSIRAHLPISV